MKSYLHGGFGAIFVSPGGGALGANYPQFSDGLRQLQILDAELAGHQRRAWVEVPR